MLAFTNDMTLKDMDKKGVTFACIDSIDESPSALTKFALKFKDPGIRKDFKAAALHGCSVSSKNFLLY
jgi:Ran-binding protein 3